MTKIRKLTFGALVGLLLLTGLGFLILSSPQLHSDYIRSKVGTKVVSIYGSGSGGTGFHIKADSGETYILTNNHICNLADDSDKVTIVDGINTRYTGTVVKRHPNHDLCLVDPIDNIEGLSLASGVSIGEIVAVVGHPGLRPLSIARGEIIGETKLQLVVGYNIDKERCFGKMIKVSEIQDPFTSTMLTLNGIETICLATLKASMFNGIAYGGNSGSPIVNVYGNVVGVLFAGSEQVTDSYLVPLKVIQDFLKGY